MPKKEKGKSLRRKNAKNEKSEEKENLRKARKREKSSCLLPGSIFFEKEKRHSLPKKKNLAQNEKRKTLPNKEKRMMLPIRTQM